MKNILPFMVMVLLMACEPPKEEAGKPSVISHFNSTWNIYEKISKNDDGSITYQAQPWGGLVGTFLEKNLPMDLSEYESVTMEFAEPTKVLTQLVVGEKMVTCCRAGSTSVTSSFDGQDVTSVSSIVLQAADTCTIKVKRVYFNPYEATWEPTSIWKGNCVFGEWANGFFVGPEHFQTAYQGDKLEFKYTTDKSPEITYWEFRTAFADDSNQPLEGNYSEQNDWGCVSVGRYSNVYRIVLTESDVARLKEHGMYVNGFRNIVTECNLLHKKYLSNIDGTKLSDNQ